MRNRKSRVFSLLLVGAMTVGLLAGCSNNGYHCDRHHE